MDDDIVTSERVIRSPNGKPIALYQDNELALLSLRKELENSEVTEGIEFIHITCLECKRAWQLHSDYIFSHSRMIGSKIETKFWRCVECGIDQELDGKHIEIKDGFPCIKWQFFYVKSTPTIRQPLSLLQFCVNSLRHVSSNKRMYSDVIEQARITLHKRLRTENKE